MVVKPKVGFEDYSGYIYNMSNIQAVLFDLDGTLIDSEFFYFSNWQPILAKSFGLQINFEDWIRYFAGHTLVHNVQFLKEHWGIDTSEEFMWKETRASYEGSDMKNIPLMPYAKEILQELKAADKRIALVTSSYKTTVDTVLGHHDLLSYFEFFVTRESITQPKPNPEPYLLGTSLLGLEKESILVVEDTFTGFSSAKAADLRCAVVSQHATERAKFAASDHLYNNLKEVASLVI